MRFLTALALVPLTFSGVLAESFPQADRDEFYNACSEGNEAMVAYCTCFVEQVEAGYSLAEFKEILQTMDQNTMMSDQKLMNAAVACVDKVPPEARPQ